MTQIQPEPTLTLDGPWTPDDIAFIIRSDKKFRDVTPTIIENGNAPIKMAWFNNHSRVSFHQLVYQLLPLIFTAKVFILLEVDVDSNKLDLGNEQLLRAKTACQEARDRARELAENCIAIVYVTTKVTKT